MLELKRLYYRPELNETVMILCFLMLVYEIYFDLTKTGKYTTSLTSRIDCTFCILF